MKQVNMDMYYISGEECEVFIMTYCSVSGMNATLPHCHTGHHGKRQTVKARPGPGPESDVMQSNNLLCLGSSVLFLKITTSC